MVIKILKRKIIAQILKNLNTFIKITYINYIKIKIYENAVSLSVEDLKYIFRT